MITCEVFSHVYFALPPIPRCFVYLDSVVTFGIPVYIGLQK